MPIRKALLAALLVLITLSPQLQLILNAKETAMNTKHRVEAVEVFSIPRVHAQTTVRRATRIGETAEGFIARAIQVFVLVDWFAVIAVQTLLDPDVIFGRPDKNGVRPMEVRLRRIWVTSRDIVNGIFALLLLFGAISMIVRAENIPEFFKKHIGGFVLAVILVNFSWFFPRVILDISNVLTAVIYQLPAIVAPPNQPICKGPPAGIDGNMGTTGDNGKCIYVGKFHFLPPTAEECALSIASSVGGTVGGIVGGFPFPIIIPIIPGCPLPTHKQDAPNKGMVTDDGLIAIYYEDWNEVKKRGFNIAGTNIKVGNSDLVINGLVANFTRLPDLARLRFRDLATAGQNRTATGQLRAALRFFLHIVFQLILLVALGLVLLALTGVLIARVAVIWLTVAFMPFIFIGPAMGGGFSALGNLGSENAPNIWKKFLQYAFLPVLVAIPLSIAFALAAQLYYVPGSFQGSLDIVGLENVIPIFADFRELLWMVIIIGIIWFGTFSVLESDKLAGKITGFFRGIGGSAANLAKNAVGYAPIAGLPRGILGAKDTLSSASVGSPYVGTKFRPFGSGGTAGGPGPKATDARLRAAAGGLTGGTNAEKTVNIKQGLTRPQDEAEFRKAAKAFEEALVVTKGLTLAQAQASMKDHDSFRVLMREYFKDKPNEAESALQNFRDYSDTGAGAAPNKIEFGGNLPIDLKDIKGKSTLSLMQDIASVPKITDEKIESGLLSAATELRKVGSRPQATKLEELQQIIATIKLKTNEGAPEIVKAITEMHRDLKGDEPTMDYVQQQVAARSTWEGNLDTSEIQSLLDLIKEVGDTL